jgi:hypothetical protein
VAIAAGEEWAFRLTRPRPRTPLGIGCFYSDMDPKCSVLVSARLGRHPVKCAGELAGRG